MTTPPDTPNPPGGDSPDSAAGPPDQMPGGEPAPTSVSSDRMPGGEPAPTSIPPAPAPAAIAVDRPPRLPSWRVSAGLAATMLGIGVAVGAAIGPSPSSSFAGEPIPQLLPAIAALAGAGHAPPATVQPQAVQPPPVTPQATSTAIPAGSGAGAGAGQRASGPAKSKTPASAVVSPTRTPRTAKTPTTRSSEGAGGQTLPAVTHVWLITLSGATFAQALTQPAGAPYMDRQLLPAGTLLSGWSSLQGSALASEASLLAGEAPQTLNSIVQPPCPEGAAGASCAPESAGALSAADEFLKQTVPAITASVAYREHGLIVITFGAVGNATASSLPAGASTATLSSEPPVGVLLISPFAHAGSRPKTAYDPSSPKQSLSELLH